MARKVTKEIKEKALALLKENPEGLSYSQLKKHISDFDNEFKSNTINGCIWNLDVQYPDDVYKPSRGLFVWS